MTMADSYSVTLPTRIHFGAGKRGDLGDLAQGLGSRAYLVVDPFLKGSAVERDLVGQLAARGMAHRIWHDIVPNPRASTCDKAAEDLTAFGADMVIALGGGSTIDAAKAIALVAANGGESWTFTSRRDAEMRVPERRGLPLIAIPTNAGTGAEITPYAVLSNPALKLKATIIHPFCYPDIAIVDPQLHLTKPARLTASTGIDTFLHAFEGYIGTHPNGWTDIFSLRAMELVAEYLPAACGTPDDIEARTRMAEACYMAGITLANIGVGIPHALGQALGALKDTPHGESCAAFLVSTVKWTLPYADGRLARVATMFDPALASLSIATQADALPSALAGFFERIGLKANLTSLGLASAEIGTLVDIAETNYGFDIACSQRKAGRADLIDIVQNSL